MPKLIKPALLFPAWVGMNRQDRCRPLWPTPVPRVRGDEPVEILPALKAGICSPRRRDEPLSEPITCHVLSRACPSPERSATSCYPRARGRATSGRGKFATKTLDCVRLTLDADSTGH